MLLLCVSVTLQGDEGTTFKGFLLQARQVDDMEEAPLKYGTFQEPTGSRHTCQNHGVREGRRERKEGVERGFMGSRRKVEGRQEIKRDEEDLLDELRRKEEGRRRRMEEEEERGEELWKIEGA